MRLFPIFLLVWATLVASLAVDPVRPPRHLSERASLYLSDLWKRKGGGGGGRGGGTSSSSGGRSGGSSSSSTSSSSGRGSSSSSTGGRTTTGSGVKPAYGGGAYYAGGSTVPYRSGATSPGGLVPLLFVGGAALAFWPGLWLHGAYLYHYPAPYAFRNQSSGRNESKPVVCGCDAQEECGCDANGNSTAFMADLLGNGSYAALNKSVVTVAAVNGTDTILLNGTLPNGTTAAGGTEDPNAAGGGLRALLEAAGFWPVVATVGMAVFGVL